MMALDEGSGDHQSDYSSSWGECEYLYQISGQSIQQLLLHFTQNQKCEPQSQQDLSSGTMTVQNFMAIHMTDSELFQSQPK